MSQIVNTLPPAPEDMPFENYCLCYSDSPDVYVLVNFSDLRSDTFDENGRIYTDGYYRYYSCPADSESWEPLRVTIGTPSFWFFERDKIIASTVDIYNPDGSIYCSSAKNDYFRENISVISSSITASTLTAVLNDTRTLIPILIVALVAVIGFRKAWNFLKGAVRGA